MAGGKGLSFSFKYYNARCKKCLDVTEPRAVLFSYRKVKNEKRCFPGKKCKKFVCRNPRGPLLSNSVPDKPRASNGQLSIADDEAAYSKLFGKPKQC